MEPAPGSRRDHSGKDWKNLRILRHFILPFLALLLATTATHAETVFYDDFSDGDAQDGDPVTWTPGNTGDTVSAESGDLAVIASGTDDLFASANVFDIDLQDTSIRAQLRLTVGTYIGIGARRNLDLPDGSPRGYYAYIASNGEVVIGVNGIAGDLASTSSSFRPTGEDIMMQLDTIADQVSLWVWRPDEIMPTDPLLSKRDNRVSVGNINTWVLSSGAQGQPAEGIYRFVHVADTHIPEPSTLFLTFIALVAVSGWRKWIG